MRVLIAEDDSALANFVRKGLEAEHYAVDVTTDGEQARAMAGEMDYDLLMLDLNLPRVDGVAILPHLRTRKPYAHPGFDQQKSRGRPGAMPGLGCRRLHGEAFRFFGAVSQNPGVATAQTSSRCFRACS